MHSKGCNLSKKNTLGLLQMTQSSAGSAVRLIVLTRDLQNTCRIALASLIFMSSPSMSFLSRVELFSHLDRRCCAALPPCQCPWGKHTPCPACQGSHRPRGELKGQQERAQNHTSVTKYMSKERPSQTEPLPTTLNNSSLA